MIEYWHATVSHDTFNFNPVVVIGVKTNINREPSIKPFEKSGMSSYDEVYDMVKKKRKEDGWIMTHIFATIQGVDYFLGSYGGDVDLADWIRKDPFFVGFLVGKGVIHPAHIGVNSPDDIAGTLMCIYVQKGRLNTLPNHPSGTDPRDIWGISYDFFSVEEEGKAMSKQPDKPINTESELAQHIIDRYCQYLDGAIEEYSRRFDYLKKQASNPETITDTQEYTKNEGLALEASSINLDMACFSELVPCDIHCFVKSGMLSSEQYNAQTLPEPVQKRLEKFDLLSKEIDRFMEELK